jgi:hypothetical protein
MAALTLLLLVSSWVNMLWLVSPAFHPTRFTIHWLDVLATLGVGGLWLARFFAQLDDRAPVPRHDPAWPLPALDYAHR